MPYVIGVLIGAAFIIPLGAWAIRVAIRRVDRDLSSATAAKGLWPQPRHRVEIEEAIADVEDRRLRGDL